MFRKAAKFFFAMKSIGLLKRYQEKTVQLAKIKAATMYIDGVKALRKYYIYNFVLGIGASLIALGIVLVPLAIIILMPWDLSTKITGLAISGLVDVGIGLAISSVLFSEKKWLKYSGAEHFAEEALKGE